MTDQPKENTVFLSKKEYDSLIRALKKLSALENAGVDNWEWYGDVMATLEEEDDD